MLPQLSNHIANIRDRSLIKFAPENGGTEKVLAMLYGGGGGCTKYFGGSLNTGTVRGC